MHSFSIKNDQQAFEIDFMRKASYPDGVKYFEHKYGCRAIKSFLTILCEFVESEKEIQSFLFD